MAIRSETEGRDRAGEQIREIYDILDVIGQGGSSSVSRAVHRASGAVVAIKSVQLPTDDAQRAEMITNDLRREVTIQSRLNGHDGTLRLREVYASPSTWYIVTDCCEGGDLLDQVQREVYSETEARTLIAELCTSISYMHSKGVTHRDIKAENVFIREKGHRTSVVLGDFGLAAKRTSGMSHVCGSTLYVAPEVLACMDEHASTTTPRSYGAECDMWSLGVLAYVAVTGRPPFNGSSRAQVVAKIRAHGSGSDRRNFEGDRRLAHLSPALRSLVALLLHPDPSARPSAEDVLRWQEQETAGEDTKADEKADASSEEEVQRWVERRRARHEAQAKQAGVEPAAAEEGVGFSVPPAVQAMLLQRAC